MEKGNLGQKSCEHVKSKFVEIYTPFIDQMSAKLVNNMNDIFKPTNVTFKRKKFEDKFRADMVDRWLEQYRSIWESKFLDKRLTFLDEHNQQYSGDGPSKKAWRAQGYSAEQQTQLNRNRAMSYHLLQLEEILDQQSNELKSMIIQVEHKRSYFNEISKRRAKILEKIVPQLEELNELD